MNKTKVFFSKTEENNKNQKDGDILIKTFFSF